MFIGRENELAMLEDLYRSGEFVCAVLHGRRQVGKTALIRQFLEGKKAVYFTGVEGSARQNLENLSRDVADGIGSLVSGTVFSSFASGLEYVFRGSEKERIRLFPIPRR